MTHSNSKSELSYKVITLDPSKSDGRFYHYLWNKGELYFEIKNAYSQMEWNNINILFYPLAENILIKDETVQTDIELKLHPTFPALDWNYFWNIPSVKQHMPYPAKTLGEKITGARTFQDGIKKSNNQPFVKLNAGSYRLDPNLGQRLVWAEGRQYIVGNDVSERPIGIVFNTGFRKKSHVVRDNVIKGNNVDTSVVEYHPYVDCFVLVYGQNSWGQALTIDEDKNRFFDVVNDPKISQKFIHALQNQWPTLMMESSLENRHMVSFGRDVFACDYDLFPVENIFIKGLPIDFMKFSQSVRDNQQTDFEVCVSNITACFGKDLYDDGHIIDLKNDFSNAINVFNDKNGNDVLDDGEVITTDTYQKISDMGKLCVQMDCQSVRDGFQRQLDMGLLFRGVKIEVPIKLSGESNKAFTHTHFLYPKDAIAQRGH